MKLPPILLGIAAGLVTVAALAPATGGALGKLARARAERAALAARAAEPVRAEPVVAPELAISAADAAAARAAMLARVQRLAKAGGILIEETRVAKSAEGLAALRIRVSGAEKAVLVFADTLERERPLVRLRAWEIVAIPGGGVRLNGVALGAWR